jgi:hypothetical protein
MAPETQARGGKAASHTAAAVPAEDELASDEIAENALISEKIGTRKDQQDMMRMGKAQQFKVCLD